MSTESQAGGGFRLWMSLPLLGAGALLFLFLLGLQREAGWDNLPSTLIGKPAPEFELPPLYAEEPGFSTADLMTPDVKLVNVWASWCTQCKIEHPIIARLAESGLPIHSINYKDTEAAAKAFLVEMGNPFSLIGADRNGRAGIEWGVYGVPETFVVDGQGRIVHKHIGPIREEDIAGQLLPSIEKARAGG